MPSPGAAARALAVPSVLEGILEHLRTPSWRPADLFTCPSLSAARRVAPAWDAAARALSAPHAAAWALGQLGLLDAPDGAATAPVTDGPIDRVAARLAAIADPMERLAWLQELALELAHGAEAPIEAEARNDLADRLRRALMRHDRRLASFEAGVMGLIATGESLQPVLGLVAQPFIQALLHNSGLDGRDLGRMLDRTQATVDALSPREPLRGAAGLNALVLVVDNCAAVPTNDVVATFAALRRAEALQAACRRDAAPPAAAPSCAAERARLHSLVASSPYLSALTGHDFVLPLSAEALVDRLTPADAALFEQAPPCSDENTLQAILRLCRFLTCTIASAASCSQDARIQAAWAPLRGHLERLMMLLLVARAAPDGDLEVAELAYRLHRRLPADAPGALDVLRMEGRLSGRTQGVLRHWLADHEGGGSRLPGGPIDLLSVAVRRA